MFKRLFWLIVGFVSGFLYALKCKREVQKKVEETVEKYAPEALVRNAKGIAEEKIKIAEEKAKYINVSFVAPFKKNALDFFRTLRSNVETSEQEITEGIARSSE
jgi:hypothetical protein